MNMLQANADYNDRTGSSLGSGYIGGCMGCPTCQGSGYIGGFRDAAGKTYKPTLNGKRVGERAYFNQLCGPRAKGLGSAAINRARKDCMALKVATLPLDVNLNYVERGSAASKRMKAMKDQYRRLALEFPRYDRIQLKGEYRKIHPVVERVRKGCAGIKSQGLRDYCDFRARETNEYMRAHNGQKPPSGYIQLQWAQEKLDNGQDLTKKQQNLLAAHGVMG